MSKIKSKNNVTAKLAGTSWGDSAQTLRSSAVALCYSVAEYCVPSWAIPPMSRSRWSTGNSTKPCASSPGLFVRLHTTLLLQPSDVPKPPPSLSVTFKPNHSFLFPLTSSIIRRLAWNPVDQYGPHLQGLQRRNYGENPGRLTGLTLW